jgi:hypothetical protein
MGSAAVSSLPCPVSVRPRHCERGALGCDQCLGVLALCLIQELGYDPHAANEMSVAWYLAQLGGDRHHEAQAVELRHLTAQLSLGLEAILEKETVDLTAAAAEPVAEVMVGLPTARLKPLFWMVMGVGSLAAWLLGIVLAAFFLIARKGGH